MKIRDEQDAFGHMMYDHLHGKRSYEIIEREDGFFNLSGGPHVYFAPYEEWLQIEKDAMGFVRGRVLDIGCGAGRHALYLQEQGHPVTGIDISPLAVKTCQERGLKDARVLPITQVSKTLGMFDTILMMGNNFGLVGNPHRAHWLLKRFAGITSREARIIAFIRNPYPTDLPEHLEYHAWNRERGRLSGQARIRVRYKKYATPWFELLMVSPEEMQTLLEPTPWAILDILATEPGWFCAILNKKVSFHD